MESELQQLDKLEQINKEAADKASVALSKLIDRPVEVAISKANVKKVESLSPLVGDLTPVYVPATIRELSTFSVVYS